MKQTRTSEYVTLVAVSDGAFSGYVAELREALGWDPSEWTALPESDGSDHEEPYPPADRKIQAGPSSDAGLVARSQAIKWARSLGVRFLD